MCSDRYRAHSRGLLARPRTSVTAPLPSGVQLGKFSLLGICNICRPVVTRLGVTGQPGPGIQIHSRNPRRSYRGAGSRIAPVASVVTPDGADEPVRCAA